MLNSNPQSLDPMLKRVLTPIRWDHITHAPFCDARTNELICIYLELTRIVSMMNPPLMYTETLEPFFLYSINRLNQLFNTDIRVRMEPIQPDSAHSTIDATAESLSAFPSDLSDPLVTL